MKNLFWFPTILLLLTLVDGKPKQQDLLVLTAPKDNSAKVQLTGKDEQAEQAEQPERGEQSERSVEGTLAKKQALVEKLEQEVREAEALVQDEAASCHRTRVNLQASLSASCQTDRLLKTLKKAVQCAESNLVKSRLMSEGTQEELAEKTAVLDVAISRLEALLWELFSARLVLSTMKQAANKVQCAPKSEIHSSQRNRRQMRRHRRELRNTQELFGWRSLERKTK